jgi:hypothetical protein
MSTSQIIDQVDYQLNQEPQRTRSGKDRPPRRFDKTQLHEDQHGQFVHRDYLAHALRWGWIQRQLEPGKSVLDVGCGQDLPLLKVLGGGGHPRLPSLYCGVDLNTLPEVNRPWVRLHPEFCFHERHAELPYDFDYIVNLEVIEHQSIGDGLQMLYLFHEHLAADGTLFLSTPVFDGEARAANHLHEFTIKQLQGLLEQVGFRVEKRYGTFASWADLKQVWTPEHERVYNQLKFWFGPEVMSVILAPLYPDASRNCIWICKK